MEQGLGRAAIAAGVGVQQLMNRLTDHLWLYDKAEAQTRASPSCKASREKGEVLRWFEGLSVEQRQEILLVRDREWVGVLMQMQRKLKSGPVNFFLMLDMGDPGARSGVLRSITPELLCRRPVGLLARLDAQNTAGRELRDNLLFFSSESPELKQGGASVAKKGSKKGKKKADAKKADERSGLTGGRQGDATTTEAHALAKESQIDVMVVARAFLENPQKLVQTLDRLTLGQFLQVPCGQQALGSWDETPWLHSMGYCALPFFVANRLELAIWSAWFKSNPSRSLKIPSLESAKGRPKSRLSKAASQQQSGGASAASSLEKHCSLQGWWQKLDVAQKSQVLRAGVACLGRQLAVETVRDARLGRDLKEKGLHPAALDELGPRSETVSMRTSQKDLASSQKGLQTVPWLAGLLALQELSGGGVLPSRRQFTAAVRENEEGSGALAGVVHQSSGSGRMELRGRGKGQDELEKELEWLMMTHGSQEGVKSEHGEDGLFCTSLELACTLRGRLLCRLRHMVQQLMQEHIAQDLLGCLETTADLPELSRESKASSSASKSAKKKKGSRARGVSGSPEKEPAGENQRSEQSKEVVRASAEPAPSGELPLEETMHAQQDQTGSAARDLKPSGAQAPTSFLGGGKQAVNTTPPDVYMRGAESMNETDEEERCSSSGEAWEEVGAAKRRKDRRRRTEDKDVKREPRKRALQPLEPPWAVPEGHAGQNGGMDAEGEHRKRRRRRKGKERKKEDAAPEGSGAVTLGAHDGSTRQKVAGTSSVSVNGGEKAEGLRHRGWNLAAPAFEPRSVPKPTSMLEDGRYLGRGSGLGANQNGLSSRPTGFTPYQAGEASIRTGVSTTQAEARSKSSVNQGGLSSNGAGVRPNEDGSTIGGASDRASPRTSQGPFKRSLSVGNSPDDESTETPTVESAPSGAAPQPSTLLVPITPLKHASRQSKPPADLSTSLSDGSRSQEPPPSAAKAATAAQGIPLQEEARHRWHEWPQYHGSLAPAADASREQFAAATPTQRGPAAPNGPVHVAGFVVPHSSGAVNGLGPPDSRNPASIPYDLHSSAEPGPTSSHSVLSNLTVSDSSSQAAVPPNPALPPAPQPPTVPNGTPSGPETLAPPHFQSQGQQPGDFPPAFLRPVAIHRSRSSHQLPDTGFPVEPPGPFWEAGHFSWAGRPLPGGVDFGSIKTPEQWPAGFQPGMQSLSPESHWPPNLPRITVPAADYCTDEDWLMGGGEDDEGSGRNGNAYDMESEAEASGRYVMSETEVEGPRAVPPFPDAAQDDSRIDYSRIFDGGVLYWTADNYSTLGPSRPNSLSSNDSMWIRREADISVIVDDIAGAASPSYVAADVAADVSTSPAPRERAASPLPPSAEADPPEVLRARMPRVRAVQLQGSRPSPILVRANLTHTPPRSVYRGLSPDLRYHRGLSPDTFLRHLPSYQVPPLTRQGSVGAGKDSGTGDIRWKRPSSPVLRFNPSPNHAPPAVPPLASAPRARPANVRSGSSSPRHWAPALEKGGKAPGIDAEGSFRGVGGAEFAPGGGGFTLREKLAAVAGSAGFGRNVNPLVKRGLPPLAPVTHSPDQDHPDVLIPIHHWVTIPPFDQQPESVGDQPQPVPDSQEVVSVDPAGFGEVNPLQPVVPFSPITPLSPPGTQQAPNEWALFHDLLHKEVERFCTENREEMAKKRPFQLAAISKVSKALQVLWPRSRITVFGSFITGLALPTSDIDLLVCLPPVRNLEPIKEAGILEGRNGIKETMLQHAARYLADQDWVKTDSMKTIENTAVPIIQLVAQMPLQPLQASSSPGEKTPEERSGNGSPSGGLVLASGETPGDASPLGEPGEGLRPVEMPEEGVGASGGAANETVSGAKVDGLSCSGDWEAAHSSSADEASGGAGSKSVLRREGESAPSGGKSAEGISEMHEGGVREPGGPERRTGGVSSLGVDSGSGTKSCPLNLSAAEPSGTGLPPPGASAIATPARAPESQKIPFADVSTTPLADVSTTPLADISTAERASAHIRDEAAEHGLDGRRHSAPGEVVPDEPVKGGHVAPPEAAKISWRGHVAMVRTRAGGGDVAGPESPGDQERRLVKLDISFEGVQHTGSRTTDLVRELVAQFPPLPPLVLVLKQFLTDRSLDHPYTGGLSSYCLVLLVTRFLQHQQHVSGVRAQQAGQNLGLLLMDFLHFFGCVFDPRRMGVSIRAGGMYIDRDKGHSIDPLYIEDPLNPLNNVGRNCFRILQCTKAFGEGYVLLSKQLHQLDAEAPQANLFGKILTKCSS